jgi:hypothetical protein
MPDRHSGLRERGAKSRIERRAPRGKPGTLRWLRSVLGRPVVLIWRNGSLHLALRDRRWPPEFIHAHDRTALCEELRVRLLEHGEQHAAVLHPLVAVHEALKGGGWEHVSRLPSALLVKAHLQLLMLLGREASGPLAGMAERLRQAQTAAARREERDRRDGVRDDDQLVVVEEAEANQRCG